jgi:hypothetical protein
MPRKSTKKRATTGKRRQHGKGLADWLSKAHKFVKDNKLISRGLGAFGGSNPYAMAAATAASQLGYGKKRRKRATAAPRKRATAAPKKRKATTGKRTRRTRAMHGAGIFSDLGGGIGSVFGGLGSGIGAIGHGFFGGSARRRGIVPFVGAGRRRLIR